VKSGLWSRQPVLEAHTTDVILSLSNYFFIRKHQSNPKKLETKAKDFHASLKLASSTFNSENARPAVLDDGRELYFDKGGLILPLFALQSLMSDLDFIEYVKSVYNRYQHDQGSRPGLY